MARRSNDTILETQVLIPIDEVAGEVGFGHAPEVVWRRLELSDVVQDWRYTHCVTPSKARSLVDEFSADKERAREIQAQRDAEQARKLERMNEQLRREAAERTGQQRRQVIPGGISVSAPGETRPDWMGEEDE